jgi:hypothetical protein
MYTFLETFINIIGILIVQRIIYGRLFVDLNEDICIYTYIRICKQQC